MASGDEAVAMTVERLTAYRDAGADGGFVPGLASAVDATKIVAAVPGIAINVMAMPGLASLDALAPAGVRRISAGPAFFRDAYGTAEASVTDRTSAVEGKRVSVRVHLGGRRTLRKQTTNTH